jgi:enoyl-CoA hydratase
MDFETLLFDKEDGLGIITLNRPKSLNGLNDVLLRELSQLMDLIAGDEEIKAVILTGGKKVFAAGGDIAYIASLDAVGAASFVALAQDAMDKIDRLGKPVIAAVCGLALGGGCELALAADIRLAADGAVFGLPEINLGIIPGAGGTQRLTRAVGPGWAKYLVYTGDSIDGDLALKIGLINGLFPQEQLMEEARKLAIQVAGFHGRFCSVALFSEPISVPVMNLAVVKNLKMFVGIQESAGRDLLFEYSRLGKIIDPKFMLTHRAPLNDIEQAYEIFSKKQDGCIKFAITPWEDR